MDQSHARRSNLALVTRTVFAAERPINRAAVATATAMSRSTVSRLVDDLVVGGVLAESTPATGAGRGRPGTPLGPGGQRFAALGLQVNVGYLAAVAVGLDGVVRGTRVQAEDLRGSDPEQVLTRLSALAAEVVATLPLGTRLTGAGLALPGLVSLDGKTLARAPNLGWSDVHLPGQLTLPLGFGAADVPLLAGNEADLASRTVSTARPGRAGRLRDFVYLSGETGIGGSIVIDGSVLRGKHGWAGEIGHVTVDPNGPRCPCGSTGCLEQYAGKRALLAAAGLDPATPASVLVEQVRAGDAGALEAVDRAAWALGCAMSGVINVVDVPVIVLGGHLRDLAGALAAGMADAVQQRALSAHWVVPAIEVSDAYPAPGALGAAYAELERIVTDPAPWLSPDPAPVVPARTGAGR